MELRAALMIVMSVGAASACGSFGEATSDERPVGPLDASAADAAGSDGEVDLACARARVADDFEAPELAPFWRVPPVEPTGSEVRVATDRAHSGNSSLVAKVAPSARAREAFALLDLAPADGRCPISVSFAFQSERAPLAGETLAYFRMVLDDGAWVALRLGLGDHVVLEDRTGEQENKMALAPLAVDGFTRVKLVYDPSTTPARTTVTAGDAAPVVLTHVHSSSAPKLLRFGATYASAGGTFTSWTDDVVVE